MIRFLMRFTVLLALTGAAVAARAETVTIAWTPSAEDPQIAVALDQKLWSGLEVKAVSFPSGREALEALLGGQADFAAAAELPAVVGAMRGQKFKVLAILSRYKANRILGTSKLEMHSMADLAGHKIATTIGTNVDFALASELKKAGVKAEIVNVSPPDAVPALSRGDVDAAVTFPSFTDQARRVLGDKYRELMTPGYVTHLVLMASTDILEKRPQAVAAFLAGLMKGDAVVASDPAAAQKSVLRVTGGLLKADALKAAWSDYDFKTGLDNPFLSLMVEEGQWVKERGLIKNVEPTEALFRSAIADGPLKALAPDRVTLP
jgi:ABC-type nitrate/sulfonate/bicarbonate transport system substrate-binding protein